VKFFFFGSGVGPAAEIPSLPRKKFQIKKETGGTTCFFFTLREF
jgi:hypothetical protein